jgi:hypothetical protein
MTSEDGLKLLMGSRVVHKVSGNTGEIYKFIGVWGVQVWNLDRSHERENWWWNSVMVRIPRRIKRYPRPFRFPRLEKTQICHCRIGKMAVEGPNQVRCNRCKNLVGDESFPRRIIRATSMLRKADNPKFPPKKKTPKRKVVPKRAKAKSKAKGKSKAKPKKAIRPKRKKLDANPTVLPPNPIPQAAPIPEEQPNSVVVTTAPGEKTDV